MYSWGNYEEQVYINLNNKSSVESQITVLEKDLEKAESKGKKLPPGFFAHLGMLYSEVRNSARARECFNEEKARFPESTAFMDYLLGRLR